MNGSGRCEVTGMSSHVSSGARVHVPVTTATIGTWCRGGVQCNEQGRVPQRRHMRRVEPSVGRRGSSIVGRRGCNAVGRRGRGVVVAVGAVRHGEERLMTRRTRPNDARSGSPRNRHRVRVYDAHPRVGAVSPGRGGLLLLTRGPPCACLRPPPRRLPQRPPPCCGCWGAARGTGGRG